MCSNGNHTERGIKQVDGFMSERWRIEPEYVVRVDKDLRILGVLLEPTTVVAGHNRSKTKPWWSSWVRPTTSEPWPALD